MTEQGTFNLIDEPWLPVRRLDGTADELSVREVFAAAHDLRSLQGDMPTQYAALLRLLVVVLRRALPLPANIDRRCEEWGRWWAAPTLPLELIDAYLGEWRHRFDLLHPEAPYMQVANLKATKTSGLTKLIGDHPDGHAFFTTRSGRAVESLSFAEAARWLVHCQAYDPSGIKTGATDDPRTKGGRGYPIGTGWAGSCGLLLPEGGTLKETLLLSLTMTVGGPRLDQPVWERAPLNAGVEDGHPEPVGLCDLLTWPSRRVCLTVRGNRVVDALICIGDRIGLPNRHGVEPHTAWRYSENQSKQLGGDIYMPRTHDPARALWRGLPNLLPLADTGGGGPGPAVSLAAQVVDSVALLKYQGVLPEATALTLRAIGVEYGPQSSTIAAVMDDALRLSAAVLADTRLRRLVVESVQDADHAVIAARQLADNLAAAAGRPSDGVRDRAAERAYAGLDTAYRNWIASLGPDSDTDVARGMWQRQVWRVMTGLAHELAEEAGKAAWLGRRVERLGRVIDHLDSSLALIWFGHALAKALDREAQRRRQSEPTVQAGASA